MKLASAFICGIVSALLCLSVAEAQPAPPDAYPAPPPDTNQPPPPPPGYQQPPPNQPPPPPPPGGYYRPTFRPLAPSRAERPISLYAELLGKGLLYGVGGDFNFNKWIGIGATFSYYELDWFDSYLELGIVAPYVNFYPVGGVRHALLIQAGPLLAFASGSSRGWGYLEGSGTSIAGFATVSWEYRRLFLLRLGITTFFGAGGVMPWPGLVLGGSF